MEALIKDKKEKENVLTYLELMNLKNAFLLNSKKLRSKHGLVSIMFSMSFI